MEVDLEAIKKPMGQTTGKEVQRTNGHKVNGINTPKKPVPVIDLAHTTGEKALNDLAQKAAQGTPIIDWKSYLITEEPEEVPPLISINGVPVCTPGNHSLIIGKKKSRKTLFIVWLIKQLAGDLSNNVLISDTEQGKRHVWKTRDRIKRASGYNVHVLSLRGISPEDRRKVIETAAQEGIIKLIVIDGIRDLLSNINDPDQCTELVTWIEWLTVTYGIHIINVLHQNKTDNNARGHIGTELLNKAEITIELELDEKANCTLVKCESSRDVPFESFAFTHDADGLPELVSVPHKGKAMTDFERKTRLGYVFEEGPLHRKELIAALKEHFEVGENKAGHLLAEFRRLGWIVKNGADHSPDTIYKLMVSTLKPIGND
jgi:hypothetical protein